MVAFHNVMLVQMWQGSRGGCFSHCNDGADVGQV